MNRGFLKARRGDSPFKRILIHMTLIICCIIAIYPITRIFSVSLRPGDRLLTTDLKIIPEDASWDNYKEVLLDSNFLLWLWNSILITITTSISGVILATSAGYAFSRFRFPGHRAGLLFILATQMIPASMLLLPLYIMLVRLKMINSYLGLIIAYSVTALPFTIWILKGYFDTIPPELEEAARVDGATHLGAFYKIIIPLSTPALAIAALFNFTTAWNEYLVARVVIQKSFLYTWPLGLFEFQGQFATQWGLYNAASIMISIPVLILFLYSSKWLISGLTLGAVKG